MAGQQPRPYDYQRDRIAFDGPDRDSLGERIKDAAREGYRRFVNKDQPLSDLAKRGDSAAADAIENQTRRLRGLGGIAEEMLTGKGALRYGIAGQETVNVPGTKSLKAILAPLKTQEMYRDYESLRAAEREKALAIHRPDITGNDINRAQFEINRLERKYGPDGMAMLRQVSAGHRQFERDAILTPLHEAGWISDEAYRAMLAAPESQYYASFSREMEDVERQGAPRGRQQRRGGAVRPQRLLRPGGPGTLGKDERPAHRDRRHPAGPEYLFRGQAPPDRYP